MNTNFKKKCTQNAHNWAVTAKHTHKMQKRGFPSKGLCERYVLPSQNVSFTEAFTRKKQKYYSKKQKYYAHVLPPRGRLHQCQKRPAHVTVRVRRPFGARGMSSVRYGIRLGDLKENWFLCFPIKHSTHTLSRGHLVMGCDTGCPRLRCSGDVS
jgi:hypothetical protein